MRTTAMLIRGSGSLNGIASQVSFPSMSISRMTHCRIRRRLVDDALEQLGFDRAIGGGPYVLARLCQFRVAGIIEAGSGAARLLEPGVEIAGGHPLDDKPHPGKTVAPRICPKAGQLALPAGEDVNLRGHADPHVHLSAHSPPPR